MQSTTVMLKVKSCKRGGGDGMALLMMHFSLNYKLYLLDCCIAEGCL